MKAIIQIGCCLILAASVLAGEHADTAKKQAQQCADAQVKKDYAKVVAFTHPALVKAAGGKEALTKALEAAMKEVAKQGVSIEKTAIRGAEEPKKVGNALVSLVTQEVTVKMPDGKMTQESVLLGYSYDSGKNWVFADTADLDEATYHKLFPELKGVIKLPPKKEPVTTKDK
jgi:hypothetical protein